MKKIMMGVVMVAVAVSAGVALACATCGCQGTKAGAQAGADHVHADAAAVAPDAAASVAAVAEAAAPVNAGNKFCPVMGTAVTNDSPNKVEYKGKIYNLCCPGCAEMFLKDPEAALKKLAEKEVAAK